MNTQLQSALERGDSEAIRHLLCEDSLSVNSGTPPALHHACALGKLELVRALLRHPRILVNQLDDTGSTAFLGACWGGQIDVVRELLGDARVDVNLANGEKATPLWYAACLGFQEVIFWMVASGRVLDFDKRTSDGTTPAEIARRSEQTRVADFLRMFKSNPKQAQIEMQFRLGIKGLLTCSSFFLLLLLFVRFRWRGFSLCSLFSFLFLFFFFLFFFKRLPCGHAGADVVDQVP